MQNYVLIQIFLWFLKNKYQSALLFLLEILKPRHFFHQPAAWSLIGRHRQWVSFSKNSTPQRALIGWCVRAGFLLANDREFLMTVQSQNDYLTKTQHTHTTLQIIQIHENLINSNSQAWKTLNRNISWWNWNFLLKFKIIIPSTQSKKHV